MVDQFRPIPGQTIAEQLAVEHHAAEIAGPEFTPRAATGVVRRVIVGPL